VCCIQAHRSGHNDNVALLQSFADRVEAGRLLAARLEHLKGRPDVIVLGLPRGGVVVAAEIARAIGAPLDALVVAKVRVPWQPELAMGACATGGVRVTNERVLNRLRLEPAALQRAWAEAEASVWARNRALRDDRPAPDVTGRTAVLVDDGLATGATARAAVQAVRAMGAARVILAVPVAPPDTAAELEALVDALDVLLTPRRFGAVGTFYRDFTQTTDEEARRLLEVGGDV
jgi:putative phosphoribosyl transferase